MSKAKRVDCVIIIACPIIIAFCVTKWLVPMPENLDVINVVDNFKMMLSIWVTLLGFLLAVASILLTLDNSPFINFIKDTGEYLVVLISLIVSCLFMFVAMIIGLRFVFYSAAGEVMFKYLIGSSIFTLVSILICLYFFFVIILQHQKVK